MLHPSMILWNEFLRNHAVCKVKRSNTCSFFFYQFIFRPSMYWPSFILLWYWEVSFSEIVHFGKVKRSNTCSFWFNQFIFRPQYVLTNVSSFYEILWNEFLRNHAFYKVKRSNTCSFFFYQFIFRPSMSWPSFIPLQYWEVSFSEIVHFQRSKDQIPVHSGSINLFLDLVCIDQVSSF